MHAKINLQQTTFAGINVLILSNGIGLICFLKGRNFNNSLCTRENWKDSHSVCTRVYLEFLR